MLFRSARPAASGKRRRWEKCEGRRKHPHSWLHLHGLRTALACQEGLFLGARQLSKSDSRGYDAGERMLINRTVQAAVFETTPRHILAEGLPYDRCQVGVVLAMPSHEGLQEHYVSEAQQMPGVARTQVDVVLPTCAAVLNADDPAVLEIGRAHV